MQVVRKQSIIDQTMDMNGKYWSVKGIKDTIWQNYMLVLTQWPTTEEPAGPMNGGSPFPQNMVNLSNTTMETYLQDAMPNGDFPNCMSCHANSNKKGRDFVWFVTLDAFRRGVRTPGDLFSTKGFDNSFRDTLILSRDPVVSSLIQSFGASEQK
jgi:hypothetical protein